MLKNINCSEFILNMSAKMNQKEYLKKYLSDVGIEKKKKKRKPNKTISGQTVKIIDDDIDLSKLEKFGNEELEMFTTGEDAPQIVGVIDDRPPELRAQDFKNNTKWKVFSSDNGYESSLTIQQLDSEGHVKKSGTKSDLIRKEKRPELATKDDLSPIRRRMSPDASPPRRNRSISTTKRTNLSPDLLPKRARRSFSSDLSPQRKNRGLDLSPKRKRHGRSPDLSPKRKRQSRTPDLSPKRRNYLSPPQQGKGQKPRHSPTRTRNSSTNLSPRRHNRNSNLSPRRRNRSPDFSPKRHNHKNIHTSPQQKRQHSSDSSPPRYNIKPSTSNYKHNKYSRSPDSSSSGNKMTKTLDGKTAGLQNAKSLRVESESFRKRENEIFNSLSEEMSGRNAKLVVRDKKTGRIRDMAKEAEEERLKDRKAQEKKAIYDRWCKGVKQVEDYRQRIAEENYEMNKPLARYSDDKDLDDHLRRQERDGDPMLEYIRQKEREKRKDSGLPSVPIYSGSFPENRFNIRPGYRWDGVDRSNGYEKKWFDVINKKKASEEEAYRYSTEDM